MYIKVFSDFILQNIEVDVVLVPSSGDTNGITEVIDGFSRVTSSSHTIDGKNSWVIPAFDFVGENQFVKFSL